MRRIVATMGALALVVWLGWWLRRAPSTDKQRPSPASPVASAAVPPGPAVKLAPSAPASPPLQPASTGPAATAGGSGITAAATLPEEIRRTLRENLVPGRMVFLDFALDRNGLRPVGATGAAGRAKPSGPRTGFGFVHYEVFGAGGDIVLTGSVEDPTRRRVEFPAASNDGRIDSTVQFSDEGTLAVRLPGEVAATRIVFYRDRNPLAPAAAAREVLGEFELLPRP